MEAQKKFGAVTVILLIFIAIRFLAQIISAVVGATAADMVFGGVVGAIYLVAFVGVVMKQKWGAVIALSVAVLDVISALFVGGAAAVGAIVFDILLFGLAWKEFSTFKEEIVKKVPAKKKSTRKKSAKK